MHNDYGYNKMNVSAQTGITTWRCALQQSHPQLKCKAKAYTRQVGPVEKVRVTGEHTHPTQLPPQTHLNPRYRFRKPSKRAAGKRNAKPTVAKEKPTILSIETFPPAQIDHANNLEINL